MPIDRHEYRSATNAVDTAEDPAHRLRIGTVFSQRGKALVGHHDTGDCSLRRIAQYALQPRKLCRS